MPSFGHGQLGFLAVPDDEVAWRRAHDVRPAPLFDVQLTPSGLYLLGQVLGLARSETCALIREDDGRALWRLGEALMAALSKVTEEQPVLRDWDERVAALEEGEWADDSRSLFEHLLRLASGRSDGRAYALFIA